MFFEKVASRVCEGYRKVGVVYYPFGLTFNSYRRENSTENRYLYNQGTGEKKFNTERIFDLGLDIDLTKYRAYDPGTGRWWQVDPKGDFGDQESWSTYQYAFNNPIRYNDPNGDCIPCLVLPWVVGGGAVVTEGTVIGVGLAAAGATLITLRDKMTSAGNPEVLLNPAVGFREARLKSESDKARGSNNEKTNEAAKTGQEAHRQEQKKLKEQGAETEVNVQLKDGLTVRKDAVMPDGTKVIIKPNTDSGKKSAEKREKLMNENGHKTEKIFYDPKDPKYQPGSPTYIGPKK